MHHRLLVVAVLPAVEVREAVRVQQGDRRNEVVVPGEGLSLRGKINVDVELSNFLSKRISLLCAHVHIQDEDRGCDLTEVVRRSESVQMIQNSF